MNSVTVNCKACEHSGLPILFLFHGVVATDPDFSPVSTPELGPADLGGTGPSLSIGSGLIAEKPVFKSHADSIAALGLPPIKHARYALRSLRPGTFLYVYHHSPSAALKADAQKYNQGKAKDDPTCVDPHWEVFRMLRGGALVPMGDPRFTMPVDFACTRAGHGLTTLTYRLRDAHEETKLSVGVSANFWDAKLRRNNLAHLQEIDVSAVLAGPALPKGGVRPADGHWFDTHVLDFALERLQHGGFDATSATAPRKGAGAAMHKRLQELCAHHPKTKDKGFVMALSDAIGTAEALSDLSAAVQKQAAAYSMGQHHPLCAAEAIDHLNQQVLAQYEREVKRTQPLTHQELRGPNGATRISADAQALLPPEAEWKEWAVAGVMTEAAYQSGKASPSVSGVPADSRFLRLHYDESVRRVPIKRGIVIAPTHELAKLQAHEGTRKMRRVHDGKAVEEFKRQYDAKLKEYARRIDLYNTDRSVLLRTDALRLAFARHYNSDETNKPGSWHSPGLVYMQEACAVLVGNGSITPGMEPFARECLLSPIEGPSGWALRALAFNAKPLFEPLKGVLQHQKDWYLDEDGKLDKTYDTLKGLLTDDVSKGFRARVSWANKAGMGLYYGVSGFVVGASVHLAVKAMQAQAGANGIPTDRVAALEAALKKLETAEARLAQNIEQWCAAMESRLRVAVERKPPDVTRVYKARITKGHFLDLVTGINHQSSAPGPDKSTTNVAARELAALPAGSAVLSEEMDVYFRSTHNTIQEAGSLAALNTAASRVWVKPPNGAGGAAVQVTSESLASMFRAAHRFDGAKATLLSLTGQTAPKIGTAVVQTTAAAVKRAAPVLSATVGDLAARFGLFGALLQYRLLQKNEKALEQLNERMASAGQRLTAEQRAVLEDKISAARLGVLDNWAGIVGGVAEVGAVAASSAKLIGGAVGFTIGAAVAGAVGNFANAGVNLQKAAGKYQDRQAGWFFAYFGVSVLYGLGGGALGMSAREVFRTYTTRRVLLEASLRGALAAEQVALNAAGRMAARRVLFLSFTGWGLVLTLAAFAVEGIVVYMDRTPLEAWLENSYFGNKPKFRGSSGKENKAENWAMELKALEAAVQKALDELASENDVAEAVPTPHMAAAL